MNILLFIWLLIRTCFYGIGKSFLYVNEKLTQNMGKVIDDCHMSLPERYPLENGTPFGSYYLQKGLFKSNSNGPTDHHGKIIDIHIINPGIVH
jgi:hypothetical protein